MTAQDCMKQNQRGWLGLCSELVAFCFNVQRLHVLKWYKRTAVSEVPWWGNRQPRRMKRSNWDGQYHVGNQSHVETGAVFIISSYHHIIIIIVSSIISNISISTSITIKQSRMTLNICFWRAAMPSLLFRNEY